MPLDAFGHHILPLGPNLNQNNQKSKTIILHVHNSTYIFLFYFSKEKEMKRQELGKKTTEEDHRPKFKTDLNLRDHRPNFFKRFKKNLFLKFLATP